MSFYRGHIGGPPKTIYQTTFVDPRRYTAMCFTSKEKNPYHPLKGTPFDVATVRTKFVVRPQPNVQQKILRAPKNIITVRRFARTPEPQGWSVEDYTSIYKRDYRDWRQEAPERFKTNSTYDQKLINSQRNRTFARREKQMPFESATTYRMDYVRHHLLVSHTAGDADYKPRAS